MSSNVQQNKNINNQIGCCVTDSNTTETFNDALSVDEVTRRDQRKCTCGKRNDFTCMYDKCEDCCEEKDCMKHSVNSEIIKTEIKNGSDERRICKCGRRNGFKCIYNRCAECCLNIDCFEHGIDICDKCDNIKESVCQDCNISLCAICDHCHRYYKKCENAFCEMCSRGRCPNEVPVSGIICTNCFDVDDWQRFYYGVCSLCDTTLIIGSDEDNECWQCYKCRVKFCQKCGEYDSDSEEGPLPTSHRYIEHRCALDNCKTCKSRSGCCRNNKGFDYCNKCYQIEIKANENVLPGIIRKFGIWCEDTSSDFDECDEYFIEEFVDDELKEQMKEATKKIHDRILGYVRDKNYQKLHRKYGIRIKHVKEFVLSYDKVTECPICYSEVECQVNCGHVFCMECCIKQKLSGSTSCAMCRTKLNNIIVVRG